MSVFRFLIPVFTDSATLPLCILWSFCIFMCSLRNDINVASYTISRYHKEPESPLVFFCMTI